MTTERHIRVRFMDRNGSKNLEAEIKASYTVKATIEKLVKNGFIPPLKEGEVHVLMLKRENRILPPDETLLGAGVVDGDLLQAGSIMRGGARRRKEWLV